MIVKKGKFLTSKNCRGNDMTNAEKLDLILEKVTGLMKSLKYLKRQQMKDTAKLKAMG